MTLAGIGALAARLADLCREYGIAELVVFGSVARGSARPDCEVDLLYVRAPGDDPAPVVFRVAGGLGGTVRAAG